MNSRQWFLWVLKVDACLCSSRPPREPLWSMKFAPRTTPRLSATRKPAVRAAPWTRTVSGNPGTRSASPCQVTMEKRSIQQTICSFCRAPTPSSVSSVAENVCGERWHLVGNSCLKFITAKDSYDNAKLACRSHNAVLASLTTQKKVDFVLKELQIMSVVVRMLDWRIMQQRDVVKKRVGKKNDGKDDKNQQDLTHWVRNQSAWEPIFSQIDDQKCDFSFGLYAWMSLL